MAKARDGASGKKAPKRKARPDLKVAPVAPAATLFLFGAAGDLVRRLLMPALCNLRRDGLIDDGLRIVGVDHNARSDREYANSLRDFIRDEVKNQKLDTKLWAKIAKRISYIQGDFLDDATYAAIAERIGDGVNGNAVFYLATAPRFFGDIVEHLGKAQLLLETRATFRRVIIEKPFGSDLKSAQELNARILEVMAEKQVYRMDHFLGKETVQNILVSRFANGFFEAIWNHHYIDHIQITAAETVGVEQRGSFYEGTGALRDMVPNHLMQLLAMVAMEPPSAFAADAVRDEKAKLLGAIRPTTAEEARSNGVRGQYGAATVAGARLAAYRKEAKVAPDSDTETYVALKLMIDNWRWVGVPFYLRTGKRLSARDTEIAVCFKPAPYAQFRGTKIGELKPNYLVMQIQPNEGLWLDFHAKRPGPVVELADVDMGFAYADAFELQPSTGYETLVYDCLIGDQTLFQRADAIESGWRAVQPFLDAWKKGQGEVQRYAAGSAGPQSADELLARDGRRWHVLGDEAA
ncbi:glucose-6-phosphate dehydrogenase [Hydrocarboniphaga sp.]|uniref:glucose-6-phosphate dehydrogenase n=1 Tax=Hydrocarboniphaga sp. TaxID=2033016 RepID=UPI003D0BA338